MFSKTKPVAANNKLIVACYDTKSRTYGPPRFITNEQVFLRDIHNFFTNQAQLSFDKQDQVFTNAEDFQWFKIGEYTPETAQLHPCSPEHMVSLHEVKAAFAVGNPAQTMQAQ